MGESHDPLFVGLDWATEAHQVCIINERGQVMSERIVQHSGSAIAEFIDGLLCLCEGEGSRIIIGIEVPRGALVETLIERGLAVYAINQSNSTDFATGSFRQVRRTIGGMRM
jgi:hypothetical protein